MKNIQNVYKKAFPKTAFFLFCTLFSFQQYSIAQTATSSPYSRYGIGDISGKGFGQGFALGGTNIALQNDTTPMFFVNTGNPASYANVRLTTAELGACYNRTTLSSAVEKHTLHSAALSYVSLAFPFKRWWGGSFGLIPYSSVGYNVSDHKEIDNVGGVDYLYSGSGGINQLYLGNGIKPLYGLPRMFVNSKKYERLKLEKNEAEINKILKRRRNLQGLSVGMNASYLFGSFENTRRSIFDPSTNFFNTKTGITTRVADAYLDYGVQYSFILDSLKGRDLKENVKLAFGATFAAQTDISAQIDSLSVSFLYNSIGTEIPKDTIELTENTKGSITFPLTFGFGASIKKGDHWLLAADFAMQNWSSYRSFDKTQGLKNSMRVSLGAQFVPNSKAMGNGNYLKRTNYRIGVRYAQTALELKSTQLNEYAVSIGLGLPVGRNFFLQNFSMINIGAELGQRGTTTNGLIKENFVKVSIGFTINDRWFVKPKFD